MASNSTSLCIVDLNSRLGAHLRPLDIEEVDVVGSGVHSRPDEQAVRHLAMEPLALIKWQPSDFGSDIAEDVPAHGKED